MAKSEFDLIAEYFNQPGLRAESGTEAVSLGIGDDCAVLDVPAGHHLVLSMDVLVEGVHFPEDAPADLLARRALRVNLSDLAAMGAAPLGFTLGLTLPAVNESWLKDFSDGLAEDARHFSCPLLGGDTTRGPLTVCIQVHGLVPAGAALTRSGATPGDDIYVSGSLGGAAAALADLGQSAVAETLFYLPEPRLALGQKLRGVASAMLDVSDGLLGDLAHIARASAVDMQLDASQLPLNRYLAGRHQDDALELALGGGDDYELAFTAPAAGRSALEGLANESGISLTRIGQVVEAGNGSVVCLDSQGRPVNTGKPGYQHF